MKLRVYIIKKRANKQLIEALKRFAKNKHADLTEQEYHVIKPEEIFGIIDEVVKTRDLALILVPEDIKLSFFISLIMHLQRYGHYRFKFRVYVYGRNVVYSSTTMGFKKERSSLLR